MSLDYTSSYVNRILLPGGGRKYSGTHSKGLIWLKNEAGQHFPNHLIRKGTKSILLYAHGNGGSLGDFKSITFFYAQWFNTSVFAIEYPSYGPAEGTAGEDSVNDNLRTAYNFLLFLGYPSKNIILMGYSIGTGPSIQLASELCIAGTPPGAVITVAAYLSICDIVRDLRGSIKMVASLLAGIIDNRWDSETRVQSVTCPCLFVHGELDEVIPSRHSEMLFERCGSSIKRLRVCPKADHTHFEEPGDTVDPIANFLLEFFRPETSALIAPIPARFSLCPQSILLREANMKQRETVSIAELGFQSVGDTCESTCFSLYDIVNWMMGSTPKIGNALDSYTLKDNITIRDGGKDGNNAGYQQQSLLDETSYREEDKEQSTYGARSNYSAQSYDGDSSSEISAYPPPAISPRSSSSSDAMKVLRGYYDAFNNHDIPAAVGFLANDIKVTFPDPRKNWSSCATAYDRYTTMFRKSPHLKCKFSLLDVVHDTSKTTITVYCHFTCVPSGVNTVREMVYVVEDDFIQVINNKY